MSHVFQASFLEVVSGDAVSTVRFITAGIIAAGILSMVCGPLFLYYVAAKKLEDAARPGAKPPDPKEERKARLSIAALAVDGHRPSALAGGLASGGAEVAELPPDLLATGCSVGGGAWHQSESVRHLSARAAAKRLHVFVFLVTLSLT